VKARCAAPLALALWILIVPPLSDDGNYKSKAPPENWTAWEAFATAAQCNNQRKSIEADRQDQAHTDDPGIFPDLRARNFELRCVRAATPSDQ